MLFRIKLSTCLCLLLAACSQDSEEPVSQLMRGSWYQHEWRQQVYDSTATGYVLRTDTTLLTEGCTKETRYRFNNGNVFVVEKGCLSPNDLSGEWQFSGNYLKASAVLDATTTGIEGALVGLSDEVLIIRQVQQNRSTTCDAANLCTTLADSTVRTLTYRH